MKLNLRKIIFWECIVLFSLILLYSGYSVVDYLVDSSRQKKQHNELASLVEQVQQEQATLPSLPEGLDWSSPTLPESFNYSPFLEIPHPDTGEPVRVLREYASIFRLNTDTVGWIKIPGTNINYPVLQTPGKEDHKNLYLDHDFYKESSRHGAIYANGYADLNKPSDNITLYGHKMADGTMFAALHNYKNESFYKQYPTITFDTLTEHHTYQIFSVFLTTANYDTGFTYHTFVDGDEFSFTDFYATCQSLSYYATGVEVSYGDKLLTLSTCDHTIDNGRLVVVAKRVS